MKIVLIIVRLDENICIAKVFKLLVSFKVLTEVLENYLFCCYFHCCIVLLVCFHKVQMTFTLSMLAVLVLVLSRSRTFTSALDICCLLTEWFIQLEYKKKRWQHLWALEEPLFCCCCCRWKKKRPTMETFLIPFT